MPLRPLAAAKKAIVRTIALNPGRSVEVVAAVVAVLATSM